MGKARNRSYKDLTVQQLRCLFETVRLGSFSAAAAALGVSHPTVLQQVHSLERQFGAKLVEPHERGCSPTWAGRLLIELAEPSVEMIDNLLPRFRAGVAGADGAVTVATTPRCVLEDLAPCVAEFRARRPGASFTFIELDDDEVAGVVESRGADFGFTAAALTGDQRLTLTAEPVYQLEVRLITKAGHPLARRRAIHPKDLRPYPFVNGPDAFSSSSIRAVLDRHEAYLDKPFAARASFVASIRRFVALGLGIALIAAVPASPPHPGLFERSMSEHFGHISMHLIRRRGAFVLPAGEAFILAVRERLGARPAADT
jgi:DNA-binding transcriptional LysR family regulator